MVRRSLHYFVPVSLPIFGVHIVSESKIKVVSLKMFVISIVSQLGKFPKQVLHGLIVFMFVIEHFIFVV